MRGDYAVLYYCADPHVAYADFVGTLIEVDEIEGTNVDITRASYGPVPTRGSSAAGMSVGKIENMSGTFTRHKKPSDVTDAVRNALLAAFSANTPLSFLFLSAPVSEVGATGWWIEAKLSDDNQAQPYNDDQTEDYNYNLLASSERQRDIGGVVIEPEHVTIVAP